MEAFTPLPLCFGASFSCQTPARSPLDVAQDVAAQRKRRSDELVDSPAVRGVVCRLETRGGLISELWMVGRLKFWTKDPRHIECTATVMNTLRSALHFDNIPS